MKSNIIMFFISLAVFNEAYAIHYNNCAAEVSWKASQCSEDIAWSNAKNTNQENGVGKLFIIPISSQMNVWLFEKNYCSLVRNTGSSSIVIPVNTIEEFRNFSEYASEQKTENSCNTNIDNIICGDPSPPINCVQKRIYSHFSPTSDPEDTNTYYCDGATETYSYEQVILKERHANNQIYCMNYETKTISITRACHHCQNDKSSNPGNGYPDSEKSKRRDGGGHGGNGGTTGDTGECPDCKQNTGGQTGGIVWGDPSGGSVGKKAKK